MSEPVVATPRFLGFVLGQRRTVVIDARYQLGLAATVAAILFGGVLLLAAGIHHETYLLQQTLAEHDASIARSLADASPLGWAALVTSGLAVCLAAMALVVVETHRMLGPTSSLRYTLHRLADGHYTTPTRLRAGHRLAGVAAAIDELASVLTRRARADAELLESVAKRLETTEGDEARQALAAELRDRAREKRLHLGD